MSVRSSGLPADLESSLTRSDRVRVRRQRWHSETAAIGNLLLDTITLERYLREKYSRKPTGDLLRQWKTCQRTVARLVEDYTRAIARYRSVLKISLERQLRG